MDKSGLELRPACSGTIGMGSQADRVIVSLDVV